MDGKERERQRKRHPLGERGGKGEEAESGRENQRQRGREQKKK